MTQVQLSGDALLGVEPTTERAMRASFGPEMVSLGRVAPKARPMCLPFAPYVDSGSLASLPSSTNWRTKAGPSLSRMYLNDRYGCCVISGKYHAIGLWTANDQDHQPAGVLVSPDAEILQMYNLLKAGPGDSGCVITQVLDYFRMKGMPVNGQTRRIDGYVSVDWRKTDLVRASLAILGGLCIGLNLPQDWTRNAVWDVTNSRIVGGHDVQCVDYDAQGVYVSSWGRVYQITWRAFQSTQWLEEAYAMLSPDWYGLDRLAPSGIAAAELSSDMTKIGAGTAPPLPDPVPPGPSPNPTPAPSPGGYVGTFEGTATGTDGKALPVKGTVTLFPKQ